MSFEHDVPLKRALEQQLRSLNLAGITHLPRVSAVEAPAASASARSKAPAPAPRPAVVPPAAASAANARAAAKNLFATPEPPKAASLATVPAAAGCSLTLDERLQRFSDWKGRVAACVRCQELAGTRTQTVFGVGNPEARVMFIGEAPGADEDKKGEPFVGRAGQLLDKIIAACGWQRGDVYICNVLKCRPPQNRNPSPEEAANCREFLDAQIETVNPDFIVCWGSIAARSLLDSALPIGRMRGKFYEHGRAKVLCTYHPSYLLRNPSAKKDVWEDMKLLLREMGQEPPTGA